MWNILGIVSKGDYNYAIVPNHHRATVNGYVLEHIIIAENHLGRILEENEIVHHDNHIKKDNRIENLTVKDKIQHLKDHGTETGEVYVDIKCPECGIVFSKPKNKTFLVKGGYYSCCSKKCNGKFSHKLDDKDYEKYSKIIEESVIREYRYYKYAPVAELEQQQVSTL